MSAPSSLRANAIARPMSVAAPSASVLASKQRIWVQRRRSSSTSPRFSQWPPSVR